MENWQRFFSGEGIGRILLVGGVLIVLLIALRVLLQQHQTLDKLPNRFRPLLSWLEGILGAAFLFWAIRQGLGNESWARLLVGSLLFLVVLIFAWYFLRDFIAGLLLKTEGTLRLHERCRIGEQEGEIVRLGRRALRLQTAQGALVQIPYSQVAGRAFSRQPQQTTSFQLALESELSVAQTLSQVRQLVMFAPYWSYTNVPPIVRLLPQQGENENRLELEIILPGLSEQEQEEVRAYVQQHWRRTQSNGKT